MSQPDPALSKRRRPKQKTLLTNSVKTLSSTSVDKVVLTIDGKKRQFSVHKEVRISKGVLDTRHHERFAFWRKILSEKRRARRDAERLYQEKRDWMTIHMPHEMSRQNMKTNVQQVDANVRLQDSVSEARVALDDAYYAEDIAQMMCDIFQHRQTVLMKMKVL